MTDISLTDADAMQGAKTKPGVNRFYFAAWRWHFYAGLYVVPFLIMLAVTGLIMMFIAVFDGRDGEKITVPAGEAALSYAEQEAAVAAAFADASFVEWIGARHEHGATVFRIADGEIQRMVAVNPYTAELVESWVRRDGWYDFANDIHGTLLIGDLGDRLIEIAAGFGIVLVITGLYLWWPRGTQSWFQMLVPNVTARGRTLWRSLHQTIGFYVSVLLVVFLVSGLAWAGVWSGQFVQAWSTFPADKWNDVPLSDTTHASMNHGAIKDVPWGLEQTQMPASGSDAGATGIATGMPIALSSVVAKGRSLGFDGRFRVNYPSGETGVWTLSQDSMSNDSADPTTDRTVHIDQYTGNVLAEVGFADYSLAAKGMAVGIAFHEGDMGWWNVTLNTVFCLSVIFLCVSGVVMWWLRRPAGAIGLAAPPMPREMPLWKGAAAIMLIVAMAFPLTGLTLIAVLAIDVLIIQRIRPLARALA